MSQRKLFCTSALALLLASGAFAQDRDRMRDPDAWDAAHNRFTRLVPGTVINVRPTEAIDVERKDNRVYTAVVDQDVMGTNGKMAIPRGSTVELMVRVAPDNDLILDLESVNVRGGDRYAIRTDAQRIDSAQPGIIGAIVGSINGADVRGRAVRIPRNTLLSFRLDRPLEMGVADRGVERGGAHYHDWYDQDRDRDRR
jgi:hypothetical protein